MPVVLESFAKKNLLSNVNSVNQKHLMPTAEVKILDIFQQQHLDHGVIASLISDQNMSASIKMVSKLSNSLSQ
jgi:hypothetical protein